MRVTFSKSMSGLAAFAATGLLVGCSATVNVNESFYKEPPVRFAILPMKAPEAARPERVAAIKVALEKEFESRGYPLLQVEDVRAVCGKDPACPKRAVLTSRYGVDGFIFAEISNISHTDLGIAFYNEVSGTLKIESKDGKELATVSNTDSERGGILLDSGQLRQAVAEQYENSGDAAFNGLAAKYARAVVEELPRISPPASNSDSIKISGVERLPAPPGILSLCVSGTPHGEASIVSGKARTNLREVGDGQYCGTYRVSEIWRNAAVELKSPYGESARAPLTVETQRPCRLDGQISVSSANSKPLLTVQCVAFNGRKSVCAMPEKECSAQNLNFYTVRAGKRDIQRLGESKAAQWQAPSKFSADESVYVFARQPDGSFSPATAVEHE